MRMKELLSLSGPMKSGRINRTQHLAYIVLLTYGLIGFATLVALTASILNESLETLSWPLYGGLGLGGLTWLVCFCLLKIKRLHDFDFSGWWMLLFLVPFLGGLWGFLIFCIPGTMGDNRYGPQPPAATLTEKILAFQWFAILGIALIYAIYRF